MRDRDDARHRRPGFTLTEMLIVIGLIVVLLGLILPALGGVWATGALTKSVNNLRQIATWMQQYSADTGDYIVPSRFDYSTASYKGKVRSVSTQGDPHTGTWCDVLQSEFQVGVFPDAGISLNNDYRHDSPDRALYDLVGDGIANPFRSGAPNTRNWNPDSFDPRNPEPPVPFGEGAQEKGYPGFFAANIFFNAGWQGVAGPNYTNGQIRYPEQSMYLVDSWRGEVIDYDESSGAAFAEDTGDVDFRYGAGSICLMLFLDGHSEQLAPWENLCELEGDPDDIAGNPGRGVRVRGLTERKRLPCF